MIYRISILVNANAGEIHPLEQLSDGNIVRANKLHSFYSVRGCSIKEVVKEYARQLVSTMD